MSTSNSLSPQCSLFSLDEQHKKECEELASYLSDFSLTTCMVKVEVRWLLFMVNYKPLRDESEILADAYSTLQLDGVYDAVRSIYLHFLEDDYNAVKYLEKVNKDKVKSCAIFVTQKLHDLGLDNMGLSGFVNFGCTNEDIINLAYAMMISDALDDIWIPAAANLRDKLLEMAQNYKHVSMLSSTPGGKAISTTVGKEFSIYAYSFTNIFDQLFNIPIEGKFSGSAGNYSAVSVAFPNVDWLDISKQFVEKEFYFDFNPLTAKFQKHDWIFSICDCIHHLLTILIDMDLDILEYFKRGYFQQQVSQNDESDTNTAAKKKDALKFENSLSYAELANSYFELFSRSFLFSRTYRNLSDPIVLSNISTAFCHSLLAIHFALDGFNDLAVNEAYLKEELSKHWEILIEPIQTVLRKCGDSSTCSTLHILSSKESVTKEDIHAFIHSLDILSDEDKGKLLALTPASYLGYASNLVDFCEFIINDK